MCSCYYRSLELISVCLLVALFLLLQTEAAKPVLGKYYREPDKSGPLPLHLLGILAKSIKEDHFVSDEGDVVYYEADPNLYGEIKVTAE